MILWAGSSRTTSRSRAPGLTRKAIRPRSSREIITWSASTLATGVMTKSTNGSSSAISGLSCHYASNFLLPPKNQSCPRKPRVGAAYVLLQTRKPMATREKLRSTRRCCPGETAYCRHQRCGSPPHRQQYQTSTPAPCQRENKGTHFDQTVGSDVAGDVDSTTATEQLKSWPHALKVSESPPIVMRSKTCQTPSGPLACDQGITQPPRTGLGEWLCLQKEESARTRDAKGTVPRRRSSKGRWGSRRAC
jgi:hypothetical protein